MDSAQQNLSSREIEVVELVAAGRSTAEIAGLLFLSPDTIKTHLKNIFRKCAVHNRVELAAWWYGQEALYAASANTASYRGEQAAAEAQRSKLLRIALATVILVAAVIAVSPASDHAQRVISFGVDGMPDIARTSRSDDDPESTRPGTALCEQIGQEMGENGSSVCVLPTSP